MCACRTRAGTMGNGPPGNTQGRLAHSLLREGEDADSRPEGGAWALSMELAQGPQSVLSPLTLHHLQRHHNPRGPGGERPGSGKGPADGPQHGSPGPFSWELIRGTCHQGPWVPGAVLLVGEASHTEWRKGDSTWRCCYASHGAVAAGQSPAPPGFSAHGVCVQKGTWPIRTCKWSLKAGGQGRRLPGRDRPAVGSTGARELGGRPAGSKAHCHQQPVIAGTERN